MESINFKNGLLIHKTAAYNLNHLFFQDFPEFIIATPNIDFKKYKMLIFFDNLNFKTQNIDTDEAITGKIAEKIDKIYEQIPNAICIIPAISKKDFDEANEINDDKPYTKLRKSLDEFVNYAYWSVKKNLIFEDTMNVDSQIGIIKQTEEDIKFIWWLELAGNKKYKQVIIEKPKKKEVKPIQENEASIKPIAPVPTPPPNSSPSRRKTIRRTGRPKGDGVHSTGYSNMAFVIMVLTISLLMGMGLALLILK